MILKNYCKINLGAEHLSWLGKEKFRENRLLNLHGDETSRGRDWLGILEGVPHGEVGGNPVLKAQQRAFRLGKQYVKAGSRVRMGSDSRTILTPIFRSVFIFGK